MNILRLFVVAASFLQCAHLPAQAEIGIGKTVGEISGWTIGFNEDIGGCLAAAKYKHGTTVWLGYRGNANKTYIAFTNQKWQSIEVDGEYELQLVMGRRIWRGKFTGFERTNEKGVYALGLKDEFMKELANSGGVRVLLNQKPVSALSLDGSRDALVATANCQKQHIEASTGTGTDPRHGRKGGSSGTGFFVSSNGHVVTNNHVVDNCTRITVLPVGAEATTAHIVARDKANDLALLKTAVKPTEIPALRSQMRVGESVSVFGFPLSGLLSTSGNFTMGIVTATAGIADDTRFGQISAPVQPGNSGGPLIDKYGNVIGVIVSKLDALNVAAATKDIPQNVNFAIKSSIAINFMESNSVLPSAAAKTIELPSEVIADLAKRFTVQVSCD